MLRKVCRGETFVWITLILVSRGKKQQIVDMTLNGSGIRDTARVLHDTNTVMKELKKEPSSSK